MYQEISGEHKNPLAVVSGKAFCIKKCAKSNMQRHPLWRRVNKEAAESS